MRNEPLAAARACIADAARGPEGLSGRGAAATALAGKSAKLYRLTQPMRHLPQDRIAPPTPPVPADAKRAPGRKS